MNQSELLSTFDYDAKTGDLIRKSTNKITGTPDQSGYKRTKYKNKTNTVHRIIYIMHHGPIPDHYHVDHIDHDRSNNRIENLQALTPYNNIIKRKPNTNTKTKPYIVYKTSKGWIAKVTMRVGIYHNQQDAIDRCESVVTDLS